MLETLLIVDDEPNILRALTRVFRNSGHQIFTANSAQEGLKLLLENEIQVIVSDQRMPIMTGTRFLTQVKKNYPDTIRIILSGYADFDAIKKAINKGFIYKFISKPWDDELLRQHIREAFQTYALQSKNKHANQILENSLEGVVITNENGEVIQVNPAYTKITGYSKADALGNKVIIFAHHPENPTQKKINNALTKTGNWRGEIWSMRKNGELYPAWITMTISDMPHARQYIYIMLDLSKQKEQEKNLVNQMYLDKLTGLNNRLYFANQLGIATEKSYKNHAELTIISIDLDRFGVINQNLGYEAGNLVLQEVGTRLKTWADDHNILARMGNDEFAFLLKTKLSVDELQLILQKIADLFRLPLLIANVPIYLTASIGVSRFPLDGTLPDSLINCANLALLASKELGGNTCQFYNENMIKSLQTQLDLEAELHLALEQEQFVLFYQPVVLAATREIVGMEALLRWQHPVKGLLTPDYFLALVESTGLIIPLGAWILRESCQQLKKFQDLGFPELNLAINVSSLQFNHPELLGFIKKVIKETNVSALCVEIEITESLCMQNIEAKIKLLRKLRSLGLQLAIDDFGTGYSSMSYLKRLPFNILKIDQSFIRDMLATDSNSSIVQAIITLAKSLGMTTIAEGVETEAQLRLLQEMQCDLIQGYFFSKPVPAHEFQQLLTS